MAKTLEVTFGKKDDETNTIVQLGTVSLRVPETLEEGVQMWGSEVILTNAIANVKVKAQAIARGAESVEEAQKVMDSWVPGVARERATGGSSEAAAIKKLASMSPERIRQLLAEQGIEL